MTANGILALTNTWRRGTMKRENDFGPAIKDFFFRAGDFKGG